MFKSIYNYIGWIIQEHMPDIKHYAYYFNQEFDSEQINSYPAIYIEVIPFSISDTLNNGQVIEFDIHLHLFANVLQSFTWKDGNKDRSGDFLDYFDRVNSILLLNRDVPSEYYTHKIQSLKRTGMRITNATDTKKEATISFRGIVLDNSLTPQQAFAINEQNKLTINIENNG